LEDKLSESSNNETTNIIDETAREEKLTELDILKQSLEDKNRKAGDYYDQLLRLQAEFDNYRKRVEKEKRDHLIWGKEKVLLKQISLIDMLEHASQSIKGTTNIEKIIEGIELIKKEFEKIVYSEGIEEIDSVGVKFDPNLHEAIEHVDSPKEEGTVTEVLQKGYTLNGRVIRPAKVKVARNSEKNNQTGGNENG
jgi:molecular chaperone GrpE